MHSLTFNKFGFLITLAVFLFSLLFLNIVFDFWIQMAVSVSALCLIAYYKSGKEMRHVFIHSSLKLSNVILLGIVSAIFLYGVFFIGNEIANSMFDFASNQVESIYKLKNNQNKLYIALLLIFIIGPGEEIFWRGYVQRNLQRKWGLVGIVLSIFIYTSVHFLSSNFMLIIAAAVCGVFWAILYWRYQSIWINIISHTLWDVVIFLVFPIK